MMSGTPPSVYPSLQYRDCLKAIDWLKTSLGFIVHMVHKGENDRVDHAELIFENGLVMVSSTSEGGLNWAGEIPGNSDISIVARDRIHVEQLYKQVKFAGSTIVKDLHESDFGKYGSSYGFTCADTEDNRWSVGTYQPMARKTM